MSEVTDKVKKQARDIIIEVLRQQFAKNSSKYEVTEMVDRVLSLPAISEGLKLYEKYKDYVIVSRKAWKLISEKLKEIKKDTDDGKLVYVDREAKLPPVLIDLVKSYDANIRQAQQDMLKEGWVKEIK